MGLPAILLQSGGKKTQKSGFGTGSNYKTKWPDISFSGFF
jgi:hypothetical protein